MCLQCGIYFREKCVLRKLLSRQCLYQRQKERQGSDELQMKNNQ